MIDPRFKLALGWIADALEATWLDKDYRSAKSQEAIGKIVITAWKFWEPRRRQAFLDNLDCDYRYRPVELKRWRETMPAVLTVNNWIGAVPEEHHGFLRSLQSKKGIGDLSEKQAAFLVKLYGEYGHYRDEVGELVE